MKDISMTKCINTLIKLFRNIKGYNTQHCLLVMVEKWKEALDKGGLGTALLTDPSKAFNCIKNDLLISKLSYLNVKKQS